MFSHWWQTYFYKKKSLQDLLSSVNAVISTNERIEFIADHMTHNPAYTLILQTTTTKARTIFKNKYYLQKLLFCSAVLKLVNALKKLTSI